MDNTFDVTRSRPSSRLPVPAHAERPHLAIEIRALDAVRLGRVADSSAMLLEHGRDVFALEARPRLLQGAAVREDDRSAVETDVREHVLEGDVIPGADAGDQRLEQ